MSMPLLLGIGIVAAIGFGGALLLMRMRERLMLRRSLNAALFRVALPRVFASQQDPYRQLQMQKEHIAVMEQLYAAFSRLGARGFWERMLLGPEHVTFEVAIPSSGEEIAFYAAAPSHLADELEKAIHGVYADAFVERINDYNIFHPHGASIGGWLRLKRHYALPFKTYLELQTDPLQAITTALSKLQAAGEGAAIQMNIRPAVPEARSRALAIARQMQKSGHTFHRARREISLFGQMWSTLFPKTGMQRQQEMHSAQDASRPYYHDAGQHPLTPLVQETVKAIEEKTSRTLFEVNVRLLAAAPSPHEADKTLAELNQAFQQFDAPNLNGVSLVRPSRGGFKQLTFAYAFRLFEKRQMMLLGTSELTSLFHFPNVVHGTPNVVFLKAKPAEPPANLPQDGVLLGTNNFRGLNTPIRLGTADRRRHLYTIGQTGTGKTSLLRELIRQDIEAGHGVGVIDPHGDLAEAVLALTPPSRADDIVYFNPGDTEMPLGLNMLEWKTEEQKDFAVQEMVRIFEKLFPPEVIGPMFEHNMRNAMLTLMADKENPGTIVEIPRIFTDEQFVKRYLAKVTDPVVRAFWEKEMAKTSDFHRSEMLGYLISKVGRFVENAMMRNIIGQAHSSFDLRDIMDNGKIFVANLSKGRVGEVNASLLGLVLVGKMQMAALARADTPEEQRRDFYLYIDEFQNFTTDSISTILSEARKYKLNLTLAHQFIAQLPENIREAVFGNAGTVVSFRVGPNDAEFLERQFAPLFGQQDLINIDNYNAYIRLMVNGVAERPFNLAIPKPTEGSAEVGEKLREYSRLKYGHPRVQVEHEILERSQLGAAAASPPMNPGERIA
jgi:hypothetical protein